MNSCASAVSFVCRTGYKADPLPVLPHSITKRIDELFGQLFEPFQRRAGPARAEYI